MNAVEGMQTSKVGGKAGRRQRVTIRRVRTAIPEQGWIVFTGHCNVYAEGVRLLISCSVISAISMGGRGG